MKKTDFTYSFETSETPGAIFKKLLDVEKWWSGIYSETIKGQSRKPNDEFTFEAGNGAHFSRQKLVELIPGKKIVWLVTESNLSFLDDTDEWTGSKICFDISTKAKMTVVTFTHEGLTPKIQCYKGCTGAWTQYLKNFEMSMK